MDISWFSRIGTIISNTPIGIYWSSSKTNKFVSHDFIADIIVS